MRLEANVKPWNPLLGGAPDEGGYKAKIAAVDPNYHAGKSTEFTLDLLEGPSAGMQTKCFIGNDLTKKGTPNKWATALISVGTALGKPEADVEAAIAKGMEFDPVATFTGKPCFLIVTANPGTYKDPTTGAEKANGPDREFATKGQYEQFVAAAGKPNGSGKATQTPTATGGGAPAGGDVLGKLFGS